ncbi:hypothetical protein PHET_05003 [Paragonimus heterotremus]|uniref:Uncharacterized protein n=1 Tax=Paragonimus heterotremus TaxID=100268 RepID=A0A8J4X077_9TREM|nr:hypothetical protein PHET_05003 [Paragonimus heterotremus]
MLSIAPAHRSAHPRVWSICTGHQICLSVQSRCLAGRIIFSLVLL